MKLQIISVGLFLGLLASCSSDSNFSPKNIERLEKTGFCSLEPPRERPLGTLTDYKASLAYDFNSHDYFEEQALRGKKYTTPTRKLSLNEYPHFEDDIDFDWMKIALARQLKRYRTKDLSGVIKLGGRNYSLKKVAQGLQIMGQLIEELQVCMRTNPRKGCYDDLNKKIRSRFLVFAPKLTRGDPRYKEKYPVLFTGYYTPLIPARASSQGQFKWPIYKKPSIESDRTKTRGEIDFSGGLKGKGLELAYAPDLFQLYLLHVEGGGRVLVTHDDGTKEDFYISYNGTNSQSWRFISKYMMKKGYINNSSIDAQREFMKAHPELEEEIYSTCPSYVYFKKSSHPPFGNDSVPLTDRRSIATDRKLYSFKGMLSFVMTTRPKENWGDKESDCKRTEYRQFSRFFLDQDTGGAIKGKGRVDVYFGEGEYAKYGASHMKQLGHLYFLIAK